MKTKTRRVIFVLLISAIVFTWALAMSGCRCLSCEPTIYYSPNGRPFPVNWGAPPELGTKDYRPLPYGYGHGSSTLYHWISKNKGYQSPSSKPFPRNWGKPPDIQTTDVVPLPYGYGHGSSTLYGWIESNKLKEIQHLLNDLPDTYPKLEDKK